MSHRKKHLEKGNTLNKDNPFLSKNAEIKVSSYEEGYKKGRIDALKEVQTEVRKIFAEKRLKRLAKILEVAEN